MKSRCGGSGQNNAELTLRSRDHFQVGVGVEPQVLLETFISPAVSEESKSLVVKFSARLHNLVKLLGGRMSKPVSLDLFPWERLKAETLRTICKELGVARRHHSRSKEAVVILRDIEREGCKSYRPRHLRILPSAPSVELVQQRQAAQQVVHPTSAAGRRKSNPRSDSRKTQELSHGSAGPAEPRSSGRRSRTSVKYRQSRRSANPIQPRSSRSRGSVKLAAKKTHFLGVEMPALRRTREGGDGDGDDDQSS